MAFPTNRTLCRFRMVVAAVLATSAAGLPLWAAADPSSDALQREDGRVYAVSAEARTAFLRARSGHLAARRTDSSRALRATLQVVRDRLGKLANGMEIEAGQAEIDSLRDALRGAEDAAGSFDEALAASLLAALGKLRAEVDALESDRDPDARTAKARFLLRRVRGPARVQPPASPTVHSKPQPATDSLR